MRQPLSGRHVPRSLLFALAVTAVAFVANRPVHTQSGCANAIVCENQLAGNPWSEWDIDGAGDGTIQGFTTDISVNKGETVHFKVDTTAPTFRIDIYRLGYYGGQGARKVATVSSVTGVNQPNCLKVGTTGLIDCGNWAETGSWAVPATAVSGIYIAKITRTDSGGASHVVFVVRDDQAQADVLFQTSDETWQAYNTFGGNSLYVGGPGTNPGRAYKVSYNRPITTRGTSPEDWLFNAEYPMVRWLEANGYNVSYFTGVDTDRYGATELRRHRIFMSTGHDEYWSGPQRANVEAARGAGINLAFFSGNEMFWKTRWEASIDGTATPYRTLVSYKETHANAKIDPMDPPTWTGTWRDPRFSPPADGGKPENAVTGTIFTVNCCTTTAAIAVPSTYATQPIWRNTRIAKLTSGQTATLTAGTLGYEWDENLNNGSRPAGLTALSSTTLSVTQKLQDYGSTYGSGTATHQLTLYKHSSGALVFGAGTVQWAWGLDGNHDRGGSTPDVAMQQAMVNLYSDMGVQPGSLQPGLVPGATDTQAPSASIQSPAAGATLVGSVSLTATAGDNVGVAGVQFKVDGANVGAEDTTSPYTMTWNSASVPNGTHQLTAVARDAAGNSTTSNAVSVTVANPVDTTSPTVSLTAPGSGSTVSGSTVTVSATAGDDIGVAGVQFLLDGAALGAEVSAAPYTIVWNSLTTPNGSHTLSARARDAAGNRTTSTAVSVSVANTTAALSIDATAFGDRSTLGTTIASAAFSTTAVNELLLAFVSADDAAIGNTVTGVTGGSLTWQLVVRSNGSRGASEIWRAFATTTLSSITVTATLAQSAPASITVVSLKGVDTSGASGSGAIGATKAVSASSGAPSGSITTTRSNAWVFGVGNDWDSATARTLGANQTMIHQYLATAGDTFWVQRQTTTTSTVGTVVTINDTAPTSDQSNLAICEVLPAATADTTAPTVSVSAPASGASVAGMVTVTASASDAGGVAGIQFLLDGTTLGTEVTSAPYSLAWNTTTAAPGAHMLSARARDVAGNSATSSAISVTVDNTAPTVTMTSPVAGSVSGVVPVTASAGDNNAVAGVQFTLDGANLGAEITTAPYALNWDSSTTANGSHSISGIARDPAGNRTTAASVPVTVSNVDNVFPTVSITSPVGGATVSGTAIAITASASDNVGVVGVQFVVDGVNVGAEDLTSPYSVIWNSTAAANGARILTAVARDAAGNATTSAPVTVSVNNDLVPPVVSMTAPVDGSTVSGAAVSVTASASDNQSVAGVQFKLDGVNLGAEVTSSPYGVTWNTTGVSKGTHALTSVARDVAGNTATATAVNVTVANAAAPLAIDVAVSADRSTAAKTIATTAFTTHAANELLLAFVSADDVSAGNTVTGIAGGSLTWQLVVRTNARRGTAEIWRAFSPGVLANATVTATLSQSVAASITVVTFTGADATGTSGSGAIGRTASASGASGAPAATLTTSRADAWVFGVGTDWDTPTARTLGPNQTMVHQYLATVGDAYWVQRMTASTPTPGTPVTLNDTAPTADQWNFSAVEVLPALN